MGRMRAPLKGSVEWVAIQAREAGMTYGQYVARMEEPPAPPPYKDPEALDKEIRARRREQTKKEQKQEKYRQDRALEKAKEQWCSTLKRAREQRGLTVREAAFALGVMVGTVRNWERGRSRPRERILPQMTRLYGLDHARMNELYLNTCQDKLP